VRIFKTYGHEAIQVMTEDPYRLARDIRGIGFRTADAMAMKMGMTREAPQRLRAGVSFALQEATDDGHCGLPVDNLVTLATKLLDVDKALVRAALDHELAGAEVVGDTIGGRHAFSCAGFISPTRRGRTAALPGPRRPALAGDRRGEGPALGREKDGQDAGGVATRGD